MSLEKQDLSVFWFCDLGHALLLRLHQISLFFPFCLETNIVTSSKLIKHVKSFKVILTARASIHSEVRVTTSSSATNKQ